MLFRNRADAGEKLAESLGKYRGKNVVVYGLPRGGVVTASAIARKLNVPLSIVIARKIGHPQEREYAIAAVSENGKIVKNEEEIEKAGKVWFRKQVQRQKKEAKRRREKYFKGKKPISPRGKIAIIVDDGVATGLTLRAAISEIKGMKPKKIIVAVPVIPEETADKVRKAVNELVCLLKPKKGKFLGAVGSYYNEFFPVVDDEVIYLLGESLR